MPARRKSPCRSKSRSNSPRQVLKRRSSGKAHTSRRVTRRSPKRRSPKRRTYTGVNGEPLYGAVKLNGMSSCMQPPMQPSTPTLKPAPVPTQTLCCMTVVVVNNMLLFMIGNTPYEAPCNETWEITRLDTDILDHLDNVNTNLEFTQLDTFPNAPTQKAIETQWRTFIQNQRYWTDDGKVPCLPLTDYVVENDDGFEDIADPIAPKLYQASNLSAAVYHCIPRFVIDRKPLSTGNYKYFKFSEFGEDTPYAEQHHDAARTIAQHVFFNPNSTIARRSLRQDMEELNIIEPPEYKPNY